MFRYFLLLLLPLTIFAVKLSQESTQMVISPDDPYWSDECKRDTIPQSPINLKPPFTFMDFAAEFNFHAQTGGQILNDEGFNLKMDGDFGNFKYNNQIFNSYELSFKAPSEHTFGPTNQRFALEMQIASISPEGIRIMIAIMFSRSDENGEFIANFGFGDGLLQHLTTNQYYEIKKPIDLSDVIPTDNKFFIYEGTRTTPPCEPALWFIAYQTYKVSDAQLNDFPKQLLYKDRAITIDQREVYSTFDPKKESQTTTSSKTAASDEISTESQQSNSSKAKSQNVDSFEIVGDDTPYGDEIYPALKDVPNPRPLKNEDYIVVTSAGDPRPYLDFLKLNKDKVNSLLTELEDEKVTKNMQKAKKDFDALEATGLVNKTGAIEGQADMEKLDDVLKDLSLTGTDPECTIADSMPKAVLEKVNNNAETSQSAIETAVADLQNSENPTSNTDTESATPETTVTTTPTVAEESSVETSSAATTTDNTIETSSVTTTAAAETENNSDETNSPTTTMETPTTESTVETSSDVTTAAPTTESNTAETNSPTEATTPESVVETSSAPTTTAADTETNSVETTSPTTAVETPTTDESSVEATSTEQAVEETAFLAMSQSNNIAEGAKEKVVSVIQHHASRDPSAFFSSFHKNPVMDKGIAEGFMPLSFLELNTNSKTNAGSGEDFSQRLQNLRSILSNTGLENESINVRETTQVRGSTLSNDGSDYDFCEIFEDNQQASESESETEEDLALKAQTKEELVTKLKQSIQASLNSLPAVAERNQEEAESRDGTPEVSAQSVETAASQNLANGEVGTPEDTEEQSSHQITETPAENEEYSIRYPIITAPSTPIPTSVVVQSETVLTGPQLPLPSNSENENPLITPATTLETELDSQSEQNEQNEPATNTESTNQENEVSSTDTTTSQEISVQASSAGQQTAPTTNTRTTGSETSKTYLRGAKPIPESAQNSETDDEEEVPRAVEGEDTNINKDDIELGKGKSANETLQEDSKVIYGPKVPAKVRKQIDSEGGRGSMAYNKEQKWDEFNILGTSEWPDMCKLGQSQSPINIDFSTKFKLEPNKVSFNYEKPVNSYCELKNDGYKIVLFGDFGSAKYGDHPFYAEEVHFHYPSEHTFGDDMERTDMELQIVHRDNYGLTIVVAVFLKVSDEGETNSFLSDLGFTSDGLSDNLLGGDSYYIESSKVNLAKLVEGAFDYIKYEGSLTTPPCSQNVQWFLFNKRVQVRKDSIEKYKKVLGQESNIRGVQSINDRDLWIF